MNKVFQEKDWIFVQVFLGDLFEFSTFNIAETVKDISNFHQIYGVLFFMNTTGGDGFGSGG